MNDPATGVRTRDVTFTGRDGQVRSREDVTTKTDSGHTRSSTFTGAGGQTATREASVTRDPESGTRTKQVDWTGPQGQTASRLTETLRGEGAE